MNALIASPIRSNRRLCRTLLAGLAILGVSVMLAAKIRIDLKPNSLTYTSSAKLVTVPPACDDWGKFYASSAEILESEGWRKRAIARVHEWHSNLKEASVEIRTVQQFDSSVISVFASGSEPEFTKIFLGALIMELIDYRRETQEQVLFRVIKNRYDAISRAQQVLKESVTALETYRKKHEPDSLFARHKELTTKLEKMAFDPLPSNVKSKEGLQAELSDVLIQLAEIKRLDDEVKSKKKDHAQLSEKSDTFDTSHIPLPSYVAILEYPSYAFCDSSKFHIPLWKLWTGVDP